MIKISDGLNNLSHWFKSKRRELPWRNLPTSYRVWISEIMLQQTQVVTVIPFFEKFLARFPDVKTLAASDEADVLLHWSGLGYYSRARNILLGAKMISRKGSFPQNRAEWLEIPGVGPYTAGAILSIAQNQVEAILDGNVERVLSRVQKISRSRGEGVYKKRLWRLAEFFVKKAHSLQISPSILNQALMELGAMVCTPTRPKCSLCPLQERCKAHLSSLETAYPEKKKKKEWVVVEEKVHCIVNASGYVLLRKRGVKEWRAGLWDMMDTLPQSLVQRCENLGECETRHVVTRHKIRRVTQIWKLKTDESFQMRDSLGHTELSWERAATPQVATGSAFTKTIKEINSRFPDVLSGMH